MPIGKHWSALSTAAKHELVAYGMACRLRTPAGRRHSPHDVRACPYRGSPPSRCAAMWMISARLFAPNFSIMRAL